MEKQLLVIQHYPWEGPGKFLLKAAKHHKVKLHIIKVYQQEIPSASSYAGLLILGGSPNVNEEEKFSFLVREKKFIKESIAADIPCLGICLGHQLIAQALGADVGSNFCTSIGFLEGLLTEQGKEHPIFQGLPIHMPLFKWHSQAVLPPVPKHMNILATSTECQVEAFSVIDRPHIIGVQFDNHAADPQDLAIWEKKDKWLHSLEKKGINTSKKIDEVRKSTALLEEQFDIFFNNFISLL